MSIPIIAFTGFLIWMSFCAAVTKVMEASQSLFITGFPSTMGTLVGTLLVSLIPYLIVAFRGYRIARERDWTVELDKWNKFFHIVIP